MADMKWFWRLVCEPDCSDMCQVNCPGCRELAGEWESQGFSTPVRDAPPVKFRWSRFPELWRCWSKSVSARMFTRIVPGRRLRHDQTAPVAPAVSAGCGCHDPVAATSTIKDEVRKYYSIQATDVLASSAEGCCTPAVPADVSCVGSYAQSDLASIPVEAVLASLGCGNPLALANLRSGEVVLDLGSGGGMDVLVAAGRVAPSGRVVGLDMSDEMLELARANAVKVGAANVEFLKGDLEAIPLPDDSVDVIISNCVVNLSPDKLRSLREAHRVLRPGGRLAISDIVTREPVPNALKGSLAAWAACIGGALSDGEYREFLATAGFSGIVIERGREYTAADAESAGVAPLLQRAGLGAALRLGFASTNIKAVKESRVEPLRTTDDVNDLAAADKSSR